MLEQVDLKKIFVDSSRLITEEEFNDSVAIAEKTQESLQSFILGRYFVTEEQFIALLADYYKTPSTRLQISDIEPEALKLVSKEYAERHSIVPFKITSEELSVAVVNPDDADAISKLNAGSSKVVVYVSSQEAIERALILYNGDVLGLLQDKVTPGSFGEDVTKALSNLVEAAVLAHASDIHIEPYNSETIVRLRIDGALHSIVHLDKTMHESLIARIKVVSNLKMDEHRVPQDGRFDTEVHGKLVDVRVSLVPSVWGEKSVMRVLVKGSTHYNLSSLGFSDEELSIIGRHLKSSHGMILLCGPTGSGKTTTLYSCIKSIASDRIDVVNISTVEDPIEYTIPRVTQIQIHPEVDLTFANGLRSLLRQDPDVLMVGEIRDTETAEIATRAALVGRLLLSSIHAHDAVSTIPRLFSMESDPYLLADTLRLVISQRLVRRLCIHCRESYILSADEYALLDKHHRLRESLKTLQSRGVINSSVARGKKLRLYKATGCEHCNHTGYLGRVAIYELLEITDKLRAHIACRQDVLTIRNELYADGFKTIFADGLKKSLSGITDINEVTRAVS